MVENIAERGRQLQRRRPPCKLELSLHNLPHQLPLVFQATNGNLDNFINLYFKGESQYSCDLN